jgi:uncharacterized protein YbjT (DUF2867 family)
MATKTVLLIGARGSLGSQVLDAVIKNSKDGDKQKYNVKTLIRPGSNADKVEALGVEVVRGDMMDRASLDLACQGVDVVVNTANGYGQGHPEIDVEGARNVADAVKAAKVGRYVYCSVLTCDKAKDVDHFWNKWIAEEYMKEQKIPYIALRSGVVLDPMDDWLCKGFVQGDSFAVVLWDKTVPIGRIYTPDLAKYFAEAIDLPEDANGQSIEVGWSRPVGNEEFVSLCAAKLNRKIRCFGVPKFIRGTLCYIAGFLDDSNQVEVMNYADSGLYVNSDIETQRKYFGEPPSPEEVIGRYVDKLMANKENADAAE